MVSRHEIGTPMQLGSSRGLLRDCEIFANLRLKLPSLSCGEAGEGQCTIIAVSQAPVQSRRSLCDDVIRQN